MAGTAVLEGGGAIAGVIFLDGDALPVPGAFFAGCCWDLTGPACCSWDSSSWLIRTIYTSQCGPDCPSLIAAGVTGRASAAGFAAAISYSLEHGIPAMIMAQLAQL